MTTFWLCVFLAFASFGLGYWIASHPTDARAFGQRIKDAIGRALAKLTRSGP
jgi:hypothetical protein